MNYTIYKIGVDARPLSTSISGVGRLIAETIREFPHPEKYEFYLFSHNPIHIEHSALLEKKNVKWIKGKGILAKKGATYFNLYLPAHLHQYKLDLFWGSQQVIPPFLNRQTPVILTYYDFVLYLYPASMRKIAAIQQKLFQKISINRADHIICISEATRRDLTRLFQYPENKSSVAYPGINLKNIVQMTKSRASERILQLPKKYFLSVSTIEPRKNYPFLLAAYKIYRKKAGRNKLPWIIAGKIGWEKEEFINELKEESKKNQDIRLFKSPNDIELHHLYKNATVFLFASIYEGFGIPLVEALAHHKNSIVADIPTFHEIGSDQITYLDLSNPEEWADRMIVCQNENFKPKIDLKKFTWKKSAEHVESVFSRFLSSPN